MECRMYNIIVVLARERWHKRSNTLPIGVLC